MLKYVTRRFKDTYEKGYNILYARKTWTCSDKEKFSAVEKYEAPSANKEDSRDSHEHNEYGFETEKYHHSWCEAVKWSSAFIIGWYTSQLAYFNCQLLRKNRTQNACVFFDKHKYNFDCNILRRVAFAQPDLSQQQYRSYHVQNVGNDIYKQSSINDKSVDEVDSITPFEKASVHLEKIVGQIENKLGVASLKSGDLRSGLLQLKSGAEHGNASAYFNLGLCHERGVGVQKNFQLAQNYYEEAAKLGHTNAMYNLGVYYIQGRPGIQINNNKARKLFLEAAQKGHVEAARALSLDPVGFITMQKQMIEIPQQTKCM